MAEIRRLTDSCVLVTDDFGAITMFDPGFHIFVSGEIDLETIGDVHRIANPYDEPVHIIEVQCGDYLGEDDIVRFDDNYGREGTNT